MTTKTEVLGDIVIFTASETLTWRDAIDATNNFFSSTPVKHALWDMRKASLSDFPADEFLKVAKNGSRFAEVRGEGAKSAILVTGDFNRMLMEAFSAYALDATPISFKVFVDMEKARAWLGAENP